MMDVRMERSGNASRGGRFRLLVGAAALLVAGSLPFLAQLAGPAAAAREVSVPVGIVDVDTNLGYQGAAAAGTGMVLTSSGEVLTNNHVIRGATTIRVTIVDTGRSYSAKVVGYDTAHDVAVLQLQGASGLRTVTTGDSSKVRVGDSVTAFGNAGGVGGAPSSAGGRVTGLGRSIVANDDVGNSERLTGLIQIDAALQPGDSGGPLVNSAGQTIGIDTAASSDFSFQSGSSRGFATPINVALAIAKQIESGRSSGTVHVGSTAFLGVSVSSPGFDQAVSAGALVVNVVPSSPADRAGLSSGDVITAVNGHSITTPATLKTLLLSKSPGDTVSLRWVDEVGYEHRASVRVASGPPQ